MIKKCCITNCTSLLPQNQLHCILQYSTFKSSQIRRRFQTLFQWWIPHGSWCSQWSSLQHECQSGGCAGPQQACLTLIQSSEDCFDLKFGAKAQSVCKCESDWTWCPPGMENKDICTVLIKLWAVSQVVWGLYARTADSKVVSIPDMLIKPLKHLFVANCLNGLLTAFCTAQVGAEVCKSAENVHTAPQLPCTWQNKLNFFLLTVLWTMFYDSYLVLRTLFFTYLYIIWVYFCLLAFLSFYLFCFSFSGIYECFFSW